MRKYIFIFLLLLIPTTACSSGPPAPEKGTVTNKRFEKQHWEGGYEKVCMSTGEYDDFGREKAYCSSQWEEHHTFVEDAYYLRLEDCHPDEEDSSKNKCNTGWIEVPQEEYNLYRAGDTYPKPR